MKKNSASIVSLAMAALVGGVIPYLFQSQGMPIPRKVNSASPVAPASAPNEYVISRVAGFQRTRPLLSVDRASASARFEGLRASLASLVDGLKSSGQLTSASVYVEDMQRGEWTGFNTLERYDPGSMMKVTLLLTYLSMAEEIPGFLERTWTCDPMVLQAPTQHIFPERQAQPNLSYSVAQLLELMIVYSDNRATAVLLQHVPSGRYVRTFTDLDLPAPVQHGGSYMMNARDYSVFMKALYHSSLLSPISSEYALSLMLRSTWKHGLLAGLPPGVEVAHKFGESTDAQGHQLHETGLIYAENGPYLITVMTRGPDETALPGVVAGISDLVYAHMLRDIALAAHP